MEFVEVAGGLHMAIKDEPEAFKAMVEPRLNAAVKAANDTSDLSMKDMNVPDLMASHAKVVTAMNTVFDLFPADLRPDPNAAPPGRRAAAPAAQAAPAANPAPDAGLDPADLLPPTE